MQSTKTTDPPDRWTQDEFEARIEELLNEARSTPVDRKYATMRARGSRMAAELPDAIEAARELIAEEMEV